MPLTHTKLSWTQPRFLQSHSHSMTGLGELPANARVVCSPAFLGADTTGNPTTHTPPRAEFSAGGWTQWDRQDTWRSSLFHAEFPSLLKWGSPGPQQWRQACLSREETKPRCCGCRHTDHPPRGRDTAPLSQNGRPSGHRGLLGIRTATEQTKPRGVTCAHQMNKEKKEHEDTALAEVWTIAQLEN